MAGRGPAPSANPVRRNNRGSGTTLPAEGYQGDIPEWPLPDDVAMQAKLEVLHIEQEQIERALDACENAKEANRLRYKLSQNVEKIATIEAVIRVAGGLELTIWGELWRTPQAAAWIRLNYTRDVAQYARWKAKGEAGDMDAAKEARLLADTLGLTPRSLAALRWTIAADEVAAARAVTPKESARGRIRAVD